MRELSLLDLPLWRQLLPSDAQTALLRFCLHEGPSAVEGWHDWLRLGHDAGQLLTVNDHSVRGLNLLLADALRRHAIRVDHRVATVLRLADLKEELRAKVYRRRLGQVLGALAEAGVEVVVLTGAALAETVYASDRLRHRHDIDLLIRERAVATAVARLRSLGFAPTSEDREGREVTRLVDAEGLPVELHTRLVRFAPASGRVAAVWERSAPAVIASVSTRTLSPEDTVAQVAALGLLSPRRRYLRWVADLWHVVRRHPRLDWEAVLEAARADHLALAAHTTLDYLTHRLDAPVPAAALGALGRDARLDPVGHDAVWWALWSSARREGQGVRRLLGGPRSCGRVARAILLPSPAFVRAQRGDRGLVGGYLGRWRMVLVHGGALATRWLRRPARASPAACRG